MSFISRREFATAAAATAVALSTARTVCAAAGPSRVAALPAADPLSFVHPDLRAAVQRFEQMFASQPALAGDYSTANLQARRQAFRGFMAPPAAEPAYTEHMVPGPKSAPDVRVYVINAKAGAARPAILHIHGGGFISGAAVNSVSDLQQLAQILDCVAVTVDYRLAPETPFPGALEDNYAALRWLHAQANELGVDRQRIAVMGESAGGGHAALLAIAARDRGEVPLCFQSLIYPMLDDRTGSTRAVPAHIGRYVWTAGSNRFGWGSWLGQRPGGRSAPAGAVPARVQNLAGLPPAFIGVGAIDLFVDEDIEYARRLVAAGVATELMVVPGAIHGFDGIVKEAGISQRFTQAKIDALRQAFTSGRAPKSL